MLFCTALVIKWLQQFVKIISIKEKVALDQAHAKFQSKIGKLKKMAKTNDKTIQWFSPKAGLVKTESYDKDGKLQLTTELVSLK